MQQPEAPSAPLFEGTLETVLPIAFAVVAVLVLLGFVAVGRLLVRNVRAARRAGLEARLHELDDLRRRGVITDDEHRAARAQVLAGG